MGENGWQRSDCPRTGLECGWGPTTRPSPLPMRTTRAAVQVEGRVRATEFPRTEGPEGVELAVQQKAEYREALRGRKDRRHTPEDNEGKSETEREEGRGVGGSAGRIVFVVVVIFMGGVK
ncbi:AP2/ERF domain-containing protein [Psidium guajava]|nr:AP2/ERF domain-containing protein [Psidium guajava]